MVGVDQLSSEDWKIVYFELHKCTDGSCKCLKISFVVFHLFIYYLRFYVREGVDVLVGKVCQH